jgi:adenylyltransferase/sulfurtransferase
MDPRFERQLALPNMTPAKQQRLMKAHVLLVGVGGLGCSVLDALVRAGVQHITVFDGDTVSMSNLHRQHLYAPSDVGCNKAITAVAKLNATFTGLSLQAISAFFNEENGANFILEATLIIDCTDTLSARIAIDQLSKKHAKTWIYGSVHGYETQLAVFRSNEPPFSVLFQGEKNNSVSCNSQGVWGMVPVALGYQQALEAVKYLCDLPNQLQGQLVHYNYATHQQYVVRYAAEIISPIKHPIRNENLTANELNGLLREKKCRLVDVRERHETLDSPWEAERIPMDELPNVISSWLPSETVVFICHSGYRSRIALETLKEEYHFKEVYHLKGGLIQLNS